MKKTLLAISAAGLVGIASSNAANVILSNVVTGTGSTDFLIQKQDNSLLDGGIISVGFFPAGFDLSGGLGDINNIIGNFTVLGGATGAVGQASASLGGARPGYYEFTPFDAGNITGADSRIGLALYLFAGDAGTLAGSTEFALQQIGAIGDDVPFEQDYNSNQAPAPVNGIGTVGSFTGDASGFGSSTYTTLQLAAVPEPSVTLLGGIGLLGLLRRRR